jgi:methyl-accepting chemotaxis protein
MKVSTRLMLGFGVLCLFLVCLGAFSLITMKNVNMQTERIINNWMPAVSKAYQIKLEVDEIYRLQGKFISDPQNANMEEVISEKKAGLKSLVDAYVADSMSAKGKDVATRFFMDYEGGEATAKQIVEQAKSGHQKGALLLYDGNATRFFDDMNKSLDELISISEKEAGQAGAANQKQYDQGFRITIAAMCLIVLLAVGLSLWTIRSILSPIRKINTILKDLAGSRGDLSQRIHLHSGDEMEEMATNVNQVLETVENMVTHIRVSTAEVAASSLTIEENCSQLAVATEEISMAVTNLSGKSLEQADQTHVSRQLLQDYLSKLARMAENAQETYELAQNAKENTERGNEQMMSILEQMHIITAQNDAANATLLSFRSMLEHIEKVNKLIKSISEKTNILSLNAGIEATRAGVHGKGFTVIAGEVRKLSNDTSESAENIINLLDGVNDEVEKLTKQFAENTKNIVAGSQQIRQLTDMFHAITEKNGTVMRNGALTKEEAQEMLVSAEEISRIFDMIGGLSEEQSAVSQQISASVEEQLSNTQVIESFTKELAKQSDRLKQLVEQFNISDVNA